MSVHIKLQGYSAGAVAHRRCPSCGGTVVLLDTDSTWKRMLAIAGVLCLCCEACQVHHYAFGHSRISLTGRQLVSMTLLVAWLSLMAWWLLR